MTLYQEGNVYIAEDGEHTVCGMNPQAVLTELLLLTGAVKFGNGQRTRIPEAEMTGHQLDLKVAIAKAELQWYACPCERHNRAWASAQAAWDLEYPDFLP